MLIIDLNKAQSSGKGDELKIGSDDINANFAELDATYVKKAGDTITGDLTFSGFPRKLNFASGTLRDNGSALIWSTIIGKTLYLRPNGDTSTEGQLVLTPTGATFEKPVSVPTATDATHGVNLGQVEKLVGNKKLTQSVSGAVNLDVSEYGVFDLTLTAATDFTLTNLPATGFTRPITIYLTGAFAWTLAQGTEETGSDAYDGAINNRVQTDIVSSTKIFYQIQNL